MLEHVRGAGLLVDGRPVLVMLSGGRDSTCLLDLAVRIAGRGAVGALHVNYGLRDASGADEAHCSALCGGLGVALEVRRVHPPETGNLQAWARDARYGAAAELARRRRADIAAGHTATDQVETILYRLASSPSRRALLGMREREGSLIRPLLRFTREQTAAYCTERGLAWREDESNDSPAFARGRVRARLLPALREIHPAADRTCSLLPSSCATRPTCSTRLSTTCSSSTRSSVPTRSPSRACASCRSRCSGWSCSGWRIGRREQPAPGTARRAADIAALSEHGTAALDLPHGVRAIAQRGILRFERTPPIRPPEGPETGERSSPIN